MIRLHPTCLFRISLILCLLVFLSLGPLFAEDPLNLDQSQQSDWDLNQIRTWHGSNGKTFKGQYMATPKFCEIEWTDPGQLSPWMIDNEVTFRIDPRQWDGLVVIVPNKYKGPEHVGKSPPPFPKSPKS